MVKELVLQELGHLELLEFKKQKRATDRVVKKSASKLEDIDWEDLYHQRKLHSILLSDIDRYLKENKNSCRKLTSKEGQSKAYQGLSIQQNSS